MKIRYQFHLFIIILFVASCAGDQTQKQDEVTVSVPSTSTPKIPVPVFNADSAYAFVKQQVDFGPRIPGSKAHAACASWLENKFRSYMPDVTVQTGVVTTFDQKKYELKNIIASFKPNLTKRILLCAHWDTRPFADRDEGQNLNKPFDGANDGGSGVGVLLEIARQLSISQPELGVDFILFDLEDYGQPESSTFPQMRDSWCLGAQYWARNPHKPGYYARYGILLDMVGAKNPVFPREAVSMQYASSTVEKVWRAAANLGYGKYFVNAHTGAITDDHVYVNQIANIPCIVIVHYYPDERDFFGHHHRVTDNMDQIDPNTLKMVGQTVLQVLFDEQ
jgi:glutaminyl-peptide cyclotransferase